MLEVLLQGASKRNGIAVAMDYLGVDSQDCVAIGDGENDLEMLEYIRLNGGTSVAVANANPALKEAAEFVSDFTNDEDAVAKAIEKWMI